MYLVVLKYPNHASITLPSSTHDNLQGMLVLGETLTKQAVATKYICPPSLLSSVLVEFLCSGA